MQWDLTRAPSNWTDLIIKLNFNCTIGSDINKKLCVLIKLKRSSNCKWCQSRMRFKIYETLSSMGNDEARAICLGSLHHLPIRRFNHTFPFQHLPLTMTFRFDPPFSPMFTDHVAPPIISSHRNPTTQKFRFEKPEFYLFDFT